MTQTRLEHDLLGEREVPAARYYGIQTLRALENFNHDRHPDLALPAPDQLAGVYQKGGCPGQPRAGPAGAAPCRGDCRRLAI
jgi:hypothetical protein